MEILKNDKNISIIRNENIITLFSYNTKICEYNTATHTLQKTDAWGYSKTTAKHQKIFVNNYTILDYDKIKKEV